MQVHSFLEKDSSTFTHVLVNEKHKVCAIIDPVLDFDYSSGTTSTTSIDKVLEVVKKKNWQIKYIIETHAHADHLSSAAYIKEKFGGKIVIGKQITVVQEIFKQVYNLDISFKTDASQFDILAEEGTELMLGDIIITALHVPGHTPADMAYQAQCPYSPIKPSEDNHAEGSDSENNHSENSLETVVFVGDTIFAPDIGTARCDFPRGSANELYQSIQRLLSMPEETKLYLCHDYPPTTGENKRDYLSMITVGEQKKHNKHVKNGISQAEFVKMREERDATLSMPKLILPAVQVNIQGGSLPTAEDNGVRYIKVPLNFF